jgi:hypothetical protein
MVYVVPRACVVMIVARTGAQRRCAWEEGGDLDRRRARDEIAWIRREAVGTGDSSSNARASVGFVCES